MKRILQLYDLNKNRIKALAHYKTLKVESTLLTGDKVLSFLYPHDLSADIKEEMYIRTRKNEYVVKQFEKSNIDDYVTITCNLNVEELEGKVWDSFSSVEQTVDSAIKLAVAGTGWTVKNNGVNKKRTIRKTGCNALEIISQCIKTYHCEIEYDTINKIINVYEIIGRDRGAYFIDKLNLKQLTIQSDSYDFYTIIEAYGKDDLHCTVENYQYSNKKKALYWKDERYTVLADLKEDAELKLKELSVPKCAYNCNVYDLAKVNNKYGILAYSLGDTITLIDKSTKTKLKQRIVKIVEYPDSPENNTVEISNTFASFEEIQKEQQETENTVSNITQDDGTISLKAMQSGWIELNKVNVQELNAVKANIGVLNANKANIDDLKATNAEIENLKANKANITDLQAANAKIGTLEAHAASIDNLLNGNLTSANIQAGAIQAGSSIIAEGAIGSAQISDLSASKLTAGIINTAYITVQGANGRMIMKNNRLQVFDTDSSNKLFERISLGDVNGNGSQYGLRIRGKDGTTILYDEDGQTKEGFTDGYNKLEDNSLDSKKIDINSVVTRINNGTTLITGTKVQVGDRTLNVAFTTLSNTVNKNGETISSHETSISALQDSVKLKLDTQTFTSYKNTNDSNISTLTTNLSKATTDITALQGQISLKVSQTDIDNSINAIEIGGRNLALGTSNVYNDGFTNFTGAENTCFGLGNVKTEGLKVGDQITGFLEISYENIVSADGKTAKIWTQGYGNVTGWDNGTFPSSNSYTIKGTGTIQIKWISAKLGANHIRNAHWSTQLRCDYVKSGKIKWRLYKVERGTKNTAWTPAPEDVDSKITTISNKQAELTTSLNGITGRVSTAESNINTTNGNITSLQNRVSAAEAKITDSSIVTTVTSSTAYKNALNGKVDLSTYNSKVQQLSDMISTKVESNNLGSMIEQRPQNIMIGFNKINSNLIIAENYFKMTLSNGDVALQATEDGLLIGGSSTKIANSVDILNESANRIISLENSDALSIILKDKHGNYYATPAQFGGTEIQFNVDIKGTNKKLGSSGNGFSEAWFGDYKHANTGYTALPNGMVMEWGYTTINGSSAPTWVAFPLTFSITQPVVTATVVGGNLTSGVNHTVWIESYNQYGFNARSSVPCNVKYIAIGW